MNGQIDLITLISLIVAAVAIFKLRSVLGQRTDEDDDRLERLKAREREAQKAREAASGQVITLPQRSRENGDAGAPAVVTEPEVDAESRIRAYATSNPKVTAGLLTIAKLDPSLDPDEFLKGASVAYEMIVTAFADGDRKALKQLLSPEVYEGFASAISDREQRGDKIDQQFVGIRHAEIVDADIEGKGTALVTVRFVSELITSVLDKAGEVISGDAQKVSEVIDIWTFSRDVSSAKARANPNWFLEETQAPG